MTLKNLMVAISKVKSESNELTELYGELVKLDKYFVEDARIKILTDEVYSHLVDKALTLECALLKETVDTILTIDKPVDKEKLIARINYIKTTSNPTVMKYLGRC